jgi:hypothetical protein
MITKRKKTIDRFWRIYFFAYIIILILGVFSDVFGENILWTFSILIKIIDYIFCVLNITGLFAYTYEKNFFKPVFWKTFFPVLLIWHFYLNVFVMPFTTPVNITVLGWIIIDLLIYTPLYIAIYLYAFNSQR